MRFYCTYKSTRPYHPEDQYQHLHRGENLTSHKLWVFENRTLSAVSGARTQHATAVQTERRTKRFPLCGPSGNWTTYTLAVAKCRARHATSQDDGTWVWFNGGMAISRTKPVQVPIRLPRDWTRVPEATCSHPTYARAMTLGAEGTKDDVRRIWNTRREER